MINFENTRTVYRRNTIVGQALTLVCPVALIFCDTDDPSTDMVQINIFEVSRESDEAEILAAV